MKKLLLSVVALAFAFAVQAGDSKTCDKDKAACCSKAKAGDQAKASCCAASAKGAACKEAPAKQALLSPKAAAELGR